MVASYPGTVRVFTTKADITDTVYADHPNSLQEEVVALENTLGANPHISTSPNPTAAFTAVSTSFASIAARLANIEIGIVADSHTQYMRRSGGDSIQSGTSSTVGLRIRGASGQTADLLQFLSSAGATIAAFTADGSLTVNNLTVNGTQTNVAGSATALDLGATTGIAAGTGTNLGDKIQLFSSTYGFGMANSRMVAYLPANAAFAVRLKATSGFASGGTDVITLGSDGVGNFTSDAQVAAKSLPRGHIATALVTSQQGSLGAGVTDLAGASVTFTASSSRRYRVSASGLGCFSTVSGDTYQIQVLSQGGTITSARGNCDIAGVPMQSWSVFVDITGATGSITVKLTGQRLTGTGTLTNFASAGIPTILSVTDIGT